MRFKLTLMAVLALCAAFATLASAAYDIIYPRSRTAAEITTGSRYSTLGAAVNAAETAGWKRVVLPGGTHEIGTALDIDLDNFHLVFQADTIVNVIDDTSGGGVSFGTFAGDYTRISGYGRLSIDTWEDDAKVISMTGRECSVEEVTFVVGTTDGDLAGATTANPMILLDLDTCYEVGVRNVTFLPGNAVTCILATQGNGLMVTGCRFTNEDTDGSGGTGEGDTVRRLMYRGIDVQGQEFGTITNCRFWGLGSGSDEVDALVLLQRTTTPANTEESHFVLSNCVTESYFAPKAVQIRGSWGVDITGNMFGANSGPNASGEATIHITGIAGVDSGNATNILIQGNIIHNAAVVGTTGAGIYAETVDGLAILGNTFDFWQSNNVIRLRSDNVENVTVMGNHFQKLGSASATVFPVLISTGTSSDYSGDLVVGGNRIHGMIGGVVYYTGVTVSGSIIGDVIQYVAASDGISAANSDNSINDSDSLFPFLFPGDIIAIAGFNDTLTNNRIATVVSRTASKIVLYNMNGDSNLVDDDADSVVTVTLLTPRVPGNVVTQ